MASFWISNYQNILGVKWWSNLRSICFSYRLKLQGFPRNISGIWRLKYGIQLSHEKRCGCLGYIGDYTAQDGREMGPLISGNLGWWNILIWADVCSSGIVWNAVIFASDAFWFRFAVVFQRFVAKSRFLLLCMSHNGTIRKQLSTVKRGE